MMRRMRHHIVRLTVPAITSILLATGCSGDDSATTTSDATPDTTLGPTTTSSAPTPDTSEVGNEPEFPMVRGSRYCELLFLQLTETGLRATVYGTQGVSYCPQEDWEAIDATALASESGSVLVLKNGPRGWLVDAVVKTDVNPDERRTFGGLEMNRLAEVIIADPTSVGRPYTWQEVDRRTVFTFAAGSTEFFLTDPDGNRYVMQAFSQQVDPSMSEESLTGLGDRLTLPEGWTYSVETIDEDLVIETVDVKARVLQDDLLNSYSWIPTP